MAASTVHTILWAVFAAMAGSTGVFYFLAIPKPSAERSFHYITGAITMIAAIACELRPGYLRMDLRLMCAVIKTTRWLGTTAWSWSAIVLSTTLGGY
jgi:bacteriorhodopsin